MTRSPRPASPLPVSSVPTGLSAGSEMAERTHRTDLGAERRRRLAGTRVGRFAPAVVLVALLVSVGGSGDVYYVGVATQAVLYATLALGLNVVVGFGGLLDLGYAGFLAVGAYTYGACLTKLGLSPLETLPCVVLAAVLAGLVVGLPTLRLQGDYLAIVTLAFGLIAQIVARNSNWLGGATGLYGLPPFKLGPIDFTQPLGAFMWSLVGMCVVLTAVAVFRRSLFGARLLAVKNDERAALASGISAYRYRLLAYIVGAIVAALVGVEYSSVLTAISPQDFGVDLSILLLVAVILGGEGSLYGVIVGGILVALIPEAFRSVPQYRFIALGVILIAMVLIRPSGLFPAKRISLRQRSSEHQDGPTLERTTPLPAIEICRLTVHYGGVTAVREVDVTLPPGNAVIRGIIGPNGAGKTTLIDAVTGFTPGSFGSFRLGGRRIRRMNPVKIARRGLRRTFQTSRLFGELNAFENVLVSVGSDRQSVLSGADDRAAIATTALREVGLGEQWWSRRTDGLPYGCQRLVEIARALAGGDVLLLIDEPTTGLNDGERAEMAGVLRRLRELNRHVLVIDHDVSFLTTICDDVFALDYGAVIASGTCEQVLADPGVREAYLGE